MCAALLAGAALLLVGRSVSAPDWLREGIETRLAEALPGLDMDFGDVQMMLGRDGLVRVRLQDVDLRTPAGVPIASFGDVHAALAPAPLVRGRPVLHDAGLTGAILTLRRAPDGRLGVALGDVFAGDTEMRDLRELVSRIDRALSDPLLARLDQFTAAAVSLRYEDARARRGWTLDGGVLRLSRSDGNLRLAANVSVLGGGDTAATVEIGADSDIGAQAMSFGLVLNGISSADIASQSPALAWLNALDAPISGALRGSFDEAGALGPLSATLQIGAGVLQPNPATRPVPFLSARTYFDYTPSEARLDFREISARSDLGHFLAEGRAVLDGPESGWPTALTGQFAVSKMGLDPGDSMPEPIALSDAQLDFRLDLQPFRFQLGRLQIRDPALPLHLSGDVLALREGWKIALDARLDAAGAGKQDVLRFWPPGAAPRTRDWVARNVLGGEISDAVFALRIAPGARPDIHLDAGFRGAEVRYARTLPVARGGAGRLTLIRNRLVVRVAEGHVDPGAGGPLAAGGTSFVIPDVRQRPAQGVVNLRAAGSLTAALAYVDAPPLRFLEKAGRGIDLATGQLAAAGQIRLPLVRPMPRGAVRFAVDATVRDAASDSVVPDRALRAERLDLRVDNAAIAVSGRATVAGVPFEGMWRQALASGAAGQVTGRATVSPAALDAFNIALPPGTLRGAGPADVVIDLPPGGPARFAVTSDLQGLGLRIAPLGWSLSPGSRGILEVAGTLGRPVSVDRLRLSAPGLAATGRVLLRRDGALDRVELSRVRAGQWLDAPVTLRARGRGLTPSVEIGGGWLDLRALPARDGAAAGAGGAGAPLDLRFDEVRIAEGIAITGFRGSFDTAGGLGGIFTGDLNGEAPVQGTVSPVNGRSAVRLTADNAGRTLAAAGLLRNVAGGSMTLRLTPLAGTPGSYDGALDISDVRLRNAPAIGALLDAISIVGLIDQLNGPGIYFSEVEGRFRLTPRQLVLTRASAVGPSMGVSLDGYYDLVGKRMDFQGVLSPIYILNGIGQFFTRKGEGLIGFSFTLGGTADAPEVAVNPLSILTPGMFREIFRRPPPEVWQ